MSVSFNYCVTDEYLYLKAATLNSITSWVKVSIYNIRKLSEVFKVLLISVMLNTHLCVCLNFLLIL